MFKPAAISDKFSVVLKVIIKNLNYILAPFALFVFCEVEKKKIQFLYISSDVIDRLTLLQLNQKYRKWIDSFWLKI